MKPSIARMACVALAAVLACESGHSLAEPAGQSGKRSSRRATKGTSQPALYVWKVADSTRYANRGVVFEDVMENGERKHNISIGGSGGSTEVYSQKDSMVTPGSRDLHIKVNPEAGSTECAGLTCKESCTMGVLPDGTLTVDRVGIVVTDKQGRSWTSRKVRKSGRTVVAFARS